MKILFTNLVAFWKMHFAEELDLILRHIENGDEIFILQCKSSFTHGCGVDLDKNNLRCHFCKSEFNTSINMLKIKNKINIIPIQLDKIFCSFLEYKFENIEELKRFSVDSLDIGSSVASAIISGTRNPNPKIDSYLFNLAQEHIKSSIKFSIFFKKVLTDKHIEKVYVFNGRFPYYRMSLRICQNNNISIIVHERSYKINKYSLFENTYPHDLEFIKMKVKECWDGSNFSEDYKIEMIKDWYNQYTRGENKALIHFVANQRTRIKISRDKVNIGIFISSEDEFETIDEWKNILYLNQNNALEKIINSSWNKDVHFYLRVHPNLANIDNEQTKYIKNIKWDKITIIPAESPISTYKLIEDLDIVLVFGSTVGIEACHRRKPVICAGRAIYEDLEGIYKPSTHEELCEWINSYPNHNIDLDEAYRSSLKYAWFCETFGQEFKYFQQEGYNTIRYLGRKSIWSVKYHFTQKLINIRKKIIDKFIC